jgi:hypothetical protein
MFQTASLLGVAISMNRAEPKDNKLSCYINGIVENSISNFIIHVCSQKGPSQLLLTAVALRNIDGFKVPVKWIVKKGSSAQFRCWFDRLINEHLDLDRVDGLALYSSYCLPLDPLYIAINIPFLQHALLSMIVGCLQCSEQPVEAKSPFRLPFSPYLSAVNLPTPAGLPLFLSTKLISLLTCQPTWDGYIQH